MQNGKHVNHPLNHDGPVFVLRRRERRTKFEAQLMSERKKIEVFRLRETKEFLSIEELHEKCESSDQFMDILKVSFDGCECPRLSFDVCPMSSPEWIRYGLSFIVRCWTTAFRWKRFFCIEIDSSQPIFSPNSCLSKSVKKCRKLHNEFIRQRSFRKHLQREFTYLTVWMFGAMKIVQRHPNWNDDLNWNDDIWTTNNFMKRILIANWNEEYIENEFHLSFFKFRI